MEHNRSFCQQYNRDSEIKRTNVNSLTAFKFNSTNQVCNHLRGSETLVYVFVNRNFTFGTALLSQLGTTGAPIQPHSAVHEQG